MTLDNFGTCPLDTPKDAVSLESLSTTLCDRDTLEKNQKTDFANLVLEYRLEGSGDKALAWQLGLTSMTIELESSACLDRIDSGTCRNLRISALINFFWKLFGYT